MKKTAKIELTVAEVKEAVKDWVAKKGEVIIGEITFVVKEIRYDERDGLSTYGLTNASFEVETKQ